MIDVNFYSSLQKQDAHCDAWIAQLDDSHPAKLQAELIDSEAMQMAGAWADSEEIEALKIENATLKKIASRGASEGVELSAEPIADTAQPEPKAAAGDVVANYRDRGNVMQKRALFAKYGSLWESMESCFKNAHANGLYKAAKAGVRGEWFEADAVAWAKKQGNMKDTPSIKRDSLDTVWASGT